MSLIGIEGGYVMEIADFTAKRGAGFSIPAFPLRTSLFFPWKGGIASTWDFFSKTWNEAKREACAQWMSDNGMNALVFLLWNLDPRNPVSLFADGYGINGVDGAQLSILERWLKRGKDAGAVMIPTMLSDHLLDGKTYPDEEAEIDYRKIGYDNLFQKRANYFSIALPWLENYCPAILLGIESSEWASRDQHEKMIAFAKSKTTMKIGAHLQWNTTSPLPAGLDYYLHEHSYVPWDGDKKSVAEVEGEGRTVLARAPVPVGFLEYNINPWSARGREQTRALAGLPGVILVGGPT